MATPQPTTPWLSIVTFQPSPLVGSAYPSVSAVESPTTSTLVVSVPNTCEGDSAAAAGKANGTDDPAVAPTTTPSVTITAVSRNPSVRTRKAHPGPLKRKRAPRRTGSSTK